MEQLEPGIPFNNIPIAIRIEGALNSVALEQSVTEIIRRHKTLRTSFAGVNGLPSASVAPAKAMKIPVIDIGALPDDRRELEAHWLMAEKRSSRSTSRKARCCASSCCGSAAASICLLFTTHHIVCDGWSLGIFYRELTALYGAFSQGQPPPLPELEGDYAGFAHWQREYLRGDRTGKTDRVLEATAAGAQTTLDFPDGSSASTDADVSRRDKAFCAA